MDPNYIAFLKHQIAESAAYAAKEYERAYNKALQKLKANEESDKAFLKSLGISS